MPGDCILIIEDNQKNLKLIRDVLQYHGYTTLEAETAELGIELARKLQPALILMDVLLPGMDGTAAMKILKSYAGAQHTPIIALTAFAMKGDRKRLIAEGFDGYVAKPIDIKEILQVIEDYLSRTPANGL